MKEVRLYTDEGVSEQLKFQDSEFIDAFSKLLNNKLARYVVRDKTRASDAEYFQVRSADKDFATWFVGCIGVIKIIDGFYVGMLCGQLTGGKAVDFQSIAKRAQEEYTKHFPAAYDTIEHRVYSMSSIEAGQQPHLEFTYPDSDESI